MDILNLYDPKSCLSCIQTIEGFEAKVEIDAVNQYGWNCLHLACYYSNHALLTLLLKQAKQQQQLVAKVVDACTQGYPWLVHIEVEKVKVRRNLTPLDIAQLVSAKECQAILVKTLSTLKNFSLSFFFLNPQQAHHIFLFLERVRVRER